MKALEICAHGVTRRQRRSREQLSLEQRHKDSQPLFEIVLELEPPGKTCPGRFFRLPLNRSFTENEKVEK
jgi:hypothetical protein